MPDTATTIRVPMTARFLAADDDDAARPGHVRAVVSAYGVKYRIGWALWHTIEMGAFAASIAELEGIIPLFWMHGWDWTDQMPVGDALASEDDDEAGLVVDGGLYVDLDPEVARLHRAAKNKAIREWSIGYRVIASRRDTNDEAHEFVTEAELLEASLVLRGANPETRTLEVAAAPAPAGMTRVTTPAGVVVETADADLIAALTHSPAPSGAPVPASSDPDDAADRLAMSSVLEVFGDALADDNPTP